VEVKQFSWPMQFARLAYREKTNEETTARTPGNVDQISLGDSLPAKGAEGQRRQVGIIKSLLQNIIEPKGYRRIWKDVEVPAGPREIAMQMTAISNSLRK
jgi:hypothetical protein